MKLIELYDELPINNILGALHFRPDEIVYLNPEAQGLAQLREFFRMKGLGKIGISGFNARFDDLYDITSKLEAIINSGRSDEFLIDIGGGADMLLVAAGRIYERENDVVLTKIDPKSSFARVISKSSDSAARGRFASDKSRIVNTVLENAVLHGGRVSAQSEDDVYEYTSDFIADINKLWRLCMRGPEDYLPKRSSPQIWNNVIYRISAIEKYNSSQNRYHTDHYSVECYLKELKRLGVVSYSGNARDGYYGFSYKSPSVKRLLSKAGNVLEQKAYITCRSFIGKGLNDVKVGVTLDWDGKGYKKRKELREKYGKAVYDDVELAAIYADTENEVDLILMKGVIPVFVSCKNGRFDSEELYKLSSVADKFGRKYAKKLLLASDFRHMTDKQTAAHLRARAETLNIKIIDDLYLMSDDEFEKALKAAIFEA